jgi:hypothetical protein
MTKLKVLVLCFSYFTNNSNICSFCKKETNELNVFINTLNPYIKINKQENNMYKIMKWNGKW